MPADSAGIRIFRQSRASQEQTMETVPAHSAFLVPSPQSLAPALRPLLHSFTVFSRLSAVILVFQITLDTKIPPNSGATGPFQKEWPDVFATQINPTGKQGTRIG